MISVAEGVDHQREVVGGPRGAKENSVADASAIRRAVSSGAGACHDTVKMPVGDRRLRKMRQASTV
jgi:hypothetical protein